MPELKVPVDKGYVSSRGRQDLIQGELQTAHGWRYKPGDPSRLHTATLRTEFGDTTSGAIIKGLALIKYDSGGTDSLVAYSGTTLYTATPGATGTFSTLTSSQSNSASGSNLTSVHYDDRWYLGTGYDYNLTVESGGTLRTMGMLEPSASLPATASSAADSATRPASGTGDFTSEGNARDSDLNQRKQ